MHRVKSPLRYEGSGCRAKCRCAVDLAECALSAERREKSAAKKAEKVAAMKEKGVVHEVSFKVRIPVTTLKSEFVRKKQRYLANFACFLLKV